MEKKESKKRKIMGKMTKKGTKGGKRERRKEWKNGEEGKVEKTNYTPCRNETLNNVKNNVRWLVAGWWWWGWWWQHLEEQSVRCATKLTTLATKTSQLPREPLTSRLWRESQLGLVCTSFTQPFKSTARSCPLGESLLQQRYFPDHFPLWRFDAGAVSAVA